MLRSSSSSSARNSGKTITVALISESVTNSSLLQTLKAAGLRSKEAAEDAVAAGNALREEEKPEWMIK